MRTPQAVSGNGAFAFSTTLPSGGAYSVTLATAPTAPSQTCVVVGGSGTVASADITTVAVTCTINTFLVKATVSGVLGAGLVLQNNGGDALPVAADGTFAFATPIASGQPYAVAVSAQPALPTQTCVVVNPSGTIGGGDTTNVVVTCTTNAYVVGGMLSGLAGTVVIGERGDSVSR